MWPLIRQNCGKRETNHSRAWLSRPRICQLLRAGPTNTLSRLINRPLGAPTCEICLLRGEKVRRKKISNERTGNPFNPLYHRPSSASNDFSRVLFFEFSNESVKSVNLKSIFFSFFFFFFFVCKDTFLSSISSILIVFSKKQYRFLRFYEPSPAFHPRERKNFYFSLRIQYARIPRDPRRWRHDLLFQEERK